MSNFTPKETDTVLRALNELKDRSDNLQPFITDLIVKFKDEHTCRSCKGRYWFIVMNDSDDGNHIERCDACKVFNSDEDATRYALRSGQVAMANYKLVYTKG